MVRFEPRLHIDAEATGQIESMIMPLLESPTVVATDAYPFPSAAEIVVDGVHVRAATGEEMTAFLTVRDVPNPDDFEWPCDPALPAGREIEWQEKQDSEGQLDRACYLWSGEVILNSGSGTSAPFFVHERAAHAWVLSTALTTNEREMFQLQVVHYACVRHFAPSPIKAADSEFTRLNNFWISPLKSWGRVARFLRPGRDALPWAKGKLQFRL